LRTEPNLLAAGVSLLALAALVISATLYGGGESPLLYPAIALVVIALGLAVNRMLMRMRNRRSRPLVAPDRPGLGLVLLFFPLVILASAAMPLIAPGADYTFMVVIAAIWTAVTIQSAVAARRAA